MDEQHRSTGAGDRRGVSRQPRAVLDGLADHDDELTASALTRHWLEGAAIALEGGCAIDNADDGTY